IWNYTQSAVLNDRGIRTFDVQVDTGSGFSTVASTSVSEAPYVYAQHTPQVVDIGMQTGVRQLRFANVTNQGSTSAIGLDEVWFRDSSYPFGEPSPGFVGVLGNDTATDRAVVEDGSTAVFWTNAYGAPVAGTVSEVTLRFQGQSGSFELFQLRPTGVANQYNVIARSGGITPSGTAGEELTYAFPGGTGAATVFHLQPGDMLGHYGQGMPFTIKSNTAATHNNQYMYTTAPSAPSGVITLGGSGFPRSANLADYAWSVDLPGFVETVGPGAGKTGTPDTGTKYLVVLDHDPFTKAGELSTWQWFNDTTNTGGRKLTPVLLRTIDNVLTSVGIGTTRIGGVNGFQQYAFDLVSGTDAVQPGDLFGFYYGDGTSESHAGSVQYAVLSGGPTVRLFVDNNGVQLHDTYTNAAYLLNRWYSINASTIPEPGAWILLLSVLAYGLLARRRK
ncbi:MAG: PEP-CTERM sorting domain-containing protein, partial [Patescibacteria group bacterium]|nr:PEP-CTERM sorting domain-containing protein [Patescibacteria group bacterium]